MATDVMLPRLGHGMEAGTIVRWLKSEGDAVQKGDALYELDTDKVTQEVEAEASGVLLRIEVAEGEVAVGTRVAVIGEPGEALAEQAPAEQAPAAPAEPEPAAVAAAPPVAVAAAPAAATGRFRASPLARRIARERGVDLATVVGTGPDGRVVAEDVERAAAGGAAPAVAPAPERAVEPAEPAEAAPAPAPAAAPAPVLPAGEVVRVPLTSIRKTIGRRLTEAWTVPAFQISMSADMTRVLALREALVASAPDGAAKPTVSDVVTKCAASALMRHRAVNATYAEDAIELHPGAHVALAVATDRGLVVPVIRDTDRLTTLEIAQARADLVARARAGKLGQADLSGGTFTISNLGMYGVETFIAVLNPPQAAILAVAATEERPVVRDGELDVLPMMTMTLTCDHRVVDGAVAAEFLRTLKGFLEEPALQL